eukprot:CAMPEP_0172495502 /NCGR_PEP_ID=MMETSP1066-20121228/71422_1 /TAXON_ID=671091 /ORGANISM="Coscinodiscus wailesii, Strain CCMP2513" /LENGTH=215 /DNA_ID=CAMNT_0013267223 /DNA_START=40 /DNA_END=684 /DNA_ORIENTATION=-
MPPTTKQNNNDRDRNSRRHTPYNKRDNGDENATSRRVYVGNLAWEVSWQDLKDHFKEEGFEVTRADVLTSPNGRSKGCGIVEFADADQAKKAIQDMNDTELKGREIFVREDRQEHRGAESMVDDGDGGSRGGGNSCKCFVGNLDWDVAWQDLKDHMRQVGEVAYAEVMTESDGRSKGCGIVQFENEEDVEKAIEELDGTELKGRNIYVREDREQG